MLLGQEIAHAPSHALAAKLVREINGGHLKPGEKLAGLRETAQRHKVSLATVRHSFKLLAQDGFIIAQHGSGTFVNPALKLNGTKLFALITSYKRDDIENYYEPLFSITGSRRILPMISVLDHDNCQQNVEDVVARKPDCILIDVEARLFPLDKLKHLFGAIPVRYCNRWEWRPEKPVGAVLTDYAWAYGEALRLLSGHGHERIALLTNNKTPRPFLRELLRKAKAEVGFMEKDPRLLDISQELMLEKPSEFNASFKKFRPTAVFALNDYIVHLLDKYCRASAGLEKIGFFDQKYSQATDGNFTSFRIDFTKIWETAIAGFADNAEKIVYIKPELVKREN